MSDPAVLVRAAAVRWVSDDYPGWIEVTVRDFAGTEHSIVDKVPVFSCSQLTRESTFPHQFWLRGTSDRIDGDHALIVLDHDVQTTTGLRQFCCAMRDVKWL